MSGPNPGANIANATIHSGTIGAAMTAVNEGVPAIAVSTNGDPAVDGVTNPFVVDLVAALVENAAGEPLLPDRLGLNVNIPSVAAGGISIVPTELDGSDSAALDAGHVAITFVQGNYDALADPAVVAEVEDLTPVLTGLVG